MFFKLPSVAATAVVSALAAGAASRIVPAADPDTKASLKRQAESTEARKVRDVFFEHKEEA